ncbi:MAG TPA: hypothetical protein VKA50_13330 [Gammaproteobacteria bacterium]|nr:hypothetical protein [Gammaproteobacteria bacterium]
MQRKHIILVGVAGVLVVLNLWRWLPESDDTASPAADSVPVDQITAQSLRLRGVAADDSGSDHGRNLFTEWTPAPKRTDKAKPVAVSKKSAARVSAADMARKAALAELNRYRLAGVVIRSGRPLAFLLKDDQRYTATIGDTIDGHVRVEHITERKVVLKEMETHVTRTVILSEE